MGSLTARLVRFTPRAQRQVEQAHDWWQAHRPAAQGAIRESLSAAIELLRDQPGIGVPAKDPALPGVRRLTLSKVRYYLYYRERGDGIEVLAFWHTSRGQSPQIG